MAESAPVIDPALDEKRNLTEFGNSMFGKGSNAERKKVADALGRPELEDKVKFDAYFKGLKAEEEKKLTENGEHQKLATAKTEEAASERRLREGAEASLREERFRNQFIMAASGKVADIDLALSCTTKEDRNFDDSGKVKGIAAVVDRILSEKPILKATVKGALGSANGGSGDQQEGGPSDEITKRLKQMEDIDKKPRKTGNDYALKEVLRSEINMLRAAAK